MENPYKKVIKRFLILLILLFIAPFIFSVALKAERLYSNETDIYIAYTLLIIGGGLLIFTVLFGIKTFKTLMDTIFRNQ